MRTLSRVGGSLAVIALSGLLAACPGDPASNTPTSPTTPSFSGLEISGPASIAPGQSAQFTANLRLSDGISKLPTSVRWLLTPTPFPLLQVNASGLATAGQKMGETTLTAEVATGAVVRRSTKEVVILPDGTYRMVGQVSDAEFPTLRIGGARVEVTPGPLVAITDSNGGYRLYGVPAGADVRVTAAGYQPYVQNLQLNAHVTRDFPLTLSGTRLTLNGPYTLAIDVVSGCPALTSDLQHRRYDAVLTQNGPTVEVALTEPIFRLNSIGRGNRFSGQVFAGGVTFTLQGYGYYYYSYYGPTHYPNVAERLPNGTFLVVDGQAVTTGSAAGLSGPLSGGISNWDSRFPTLSFLLGRCFSSTHQFALTPR